MALIVAAAPAVAVPREGVDFVTRRIALVRAVSRLSCARRERARLRVRRRRDELGVLDDWLPFLIYALFAAAIPASMIAFSFVFATRPSRADEARACCPFESGVSDGPPQQQRFTVSFYLTAMLFILFDIEIVFLYPLAVVLEPLGWFGVRRVPLLRRDPRRRLRLHLAEGGARVAARRAKLPVSTGRCDRPPVRARALADKGPGVFEHEVERRSRTRSCSRPSRRPSPGRSRTRSGRTRSGSPAARSR